MDTTLIIARHGQSQWNAEKRFSGWYDTPLTDQGAEEAAQAGETIRKLSLFPSVVAVSEMSRTIDSAHIMCAQIFRHTGIEADRVVCERQLNERHYGELTGMTHYDANRTYGKKRVQEWLRSADDAPPPITPANIHFKTLNRTFSKAGMPRTESLMDTYRRAVPCLQRIIRDYARPGSSIMLVSHSNTMRALVKYLEGLSDRDIHDLRFDSGSVLAYKLDCRNGKPEPGQAQARYLK